MEGPSNCCEEYPLVPHRPPQFNTSFPHKNHTLSAPKMPQFHTSNPLLPPLRQFHTKNPSVHHKTPSVQHKTPSVPHQNPSVQQIPQTNTVFLVWNWRVFGVELRSFWCWTEGFLVWNWEVFGWNWGVCWTEGFLVLNRGVFGVELRGFWDGTEGCVELRGFWCWTEGFRGLKRSGPFVWNWCVELRGTDCESKILN